MRNPSYLNAMLKHAENFRAVAAVENLAYKSLIKVGVCFIFIFFVVVADVPPHFNESSLHFKANISKRNKKLPQLTVFLQK